MADIEELYRRLAPVLLTLSRKIFNVPVERLYLCMPQYDEVSFCYLPPKKSAQLYLIRLAFLEPTHHWLLGAHSQALFVNHQTKEIDFYEPQGTLAPWYPTVRDYLSQELFPNYIFHPTESFCPEAGPQTISGLSCCGLFSFLFLQDRLDGISASESVKHLLEDVNLIAYLRHELRRLDRLARNKRIYVFEALYRTVDHRALQPVQRAALNRSYEAVDHYALEKIERTTRQSPSQ